MDQGFASAPAGGDRAAAARLLAAQGDVAGAIAAATEALRTRFDDLLAAELVHWRLDGFAAVRHRAGRAAWPPEVADPFPGQRGIPKVTAADLTGDILGGAIVHHGSLHVTGVMTAEHAATLRRGIDAVFAARDAHGTGADAAAGGWYERLEVPPLAASRRWVSDCGAAWTAESPRMLHDMLEAYGRAGLIDHIEHFLGERPSLSVSKSTLRRVPITTSTDWHQDGAFLGRDVRSVNVWVALSPCGVDAAGLDVVGRRLPYVMQTGSHGSHFDWSVGPGLVDVLVEGGTPVESPVFEPGDALLFDHLMLHRTGIRPGMTKERWAIESWFFAPSTYPMAQVPLLV